MNMLNKELLAQNIEKIADYDFSNNKVFGSAYYVYQNNNFEFKKCYGVSSLKDKTPIDENTLFRLASMTKPITAFATLILVDRGLLSLDDKISKFFPEFSSIHIINSDRKDLGLSPKIPSIRNILSHTSGIGSEGSKLQDMSAEDRKTLDNSISYYIKKGLDFEPESTQMYSGTAAFDVLTKIIENISGMDYLSFLKKEIFEPLGMLDTTFIPNEEQFKRLIAMHDKVEGETAVFDMKDGCIFESFPYTHFLGGAGLVSTLSDYSKFAKLLLNKGKIENNSLISEKTFNYMSIPQVSKEIMPALERWGLGVRVITEPEYAFLPVSSFGWSGAYGSHFWIDPVNEIFAVFMKNSKFDGGAANESARKFEEAVYSSFEKL